MSKSKKPVRIPTGVGKITVLNPVWLDGGDYYPPPDNYEGDPAKFDFKKQTANYVELRDILARNNQKMDWIGVSKYEGMADYIRRFDNPKAKVMLTRFVATSPNLVWEKYEGGTAGGGRNTVYVGGKMMKTTDFLSLPPRKQDQLLSGKIAKPKYLHKFKFVISISNKTKFDQDNLERILAKFKRASMAKDYDYKIFGGYGVFVSSKVYITFIYTTEKARDNAIEAAEKVFGFEKATKSKQVVR